VNQNKYPIYLLSFDTDYLAAATFLRFQEHYESPKFRDQIFDLEAYMDWYAAERDGFTYFDDWSGFNLPDRVLDAFLAGRFDPLTRKEKALLDLFRKVPKPFYVIGAAKGETDTMAHEIVHGLFYVRPDYREEVVACLKRFEWSKVWRILAKTGYDPSVFDDEINAYCLTGFEGRLATQKKLIKAARRQLVPIFTKHFGWPPDEKNWPKLLKLVHHIDFRY